MAKAGVSLVAANHNHPVVEVFLEEDGTAHAAAGLRRILTRVKRRNQEK